MPEFAEIILRKSLLKLLDLRKCNLLDAFIATFIESAEALEKGGMVYAGNMKKLLISESDIKDDTQKRKLEEIGRGIEVKFWFS